MTSALGAVQYPFSVWPRNPHPFSVWPPQARLIGYARVSTDEQTTALQIDSLRSNGCAVIYEDQASGGSRSRPGLNHALANLKAGDTLVVWKLDRLSRSLQQLIQLSETLRDRGIALRSLTEHFDTASASGKLLYSILGAVAEFERSIIRERTISGLEAAKRRGQKIGRPKVISPEKVVKAKELLSRIVSLDVVYDPKGPIG